MPLHEVQGLPAFGIALYGILMELRKHNHIAVLGIKVLQDDGHTRSASMTYVQGDNLHCFVHPIS